MVGQVLTPVRTLRNTDAANPELARSEHYMCVMATLD